MPDLLAFLGKCSSDFLGMQTLLRIQDIQRILKIARSTDDTYVLAGIATALLSTSFLRTAEPELIQKILQAAPDNSLASMLFRVYKYQFEEFNKESLEREIGILEEVARGILDAPDKYEFRTVCMAADFLADYQHIEFSPLLDEEEKLGINLG